VAEACHRWGWQGLCTRATLTTIDECGNLSLDSTPNMPVWGLKVD